MKKSTKYFLKSIIFVVAITAMANMAAGQTNQSICAGQSATLTATGGTSYNWSTGDTIATTIVTPANTTQYWVTVTQSGNTSVNNVTVTVNPLPIANAGRDTSYCLGSFASLTATGGLHYLWSTGDTTATISGTPPNPGSMTLTVTVTNAYGCSANASVTVTFNPLPIANILPLGNIINEGHDTLFFCVGSVASLTATGGTHYLWNSGDTTATTTGTPTNPGSATFTVTVTNAYGCSARDSAKVTVNPLPIPNIVPTGNIINEGHDTVFYNVGSFISFTATGGTNYMWNTGDTTATISGTINHAVTATLIVTVTNANGCSATDSIIVIVNSNSFPPQSVFNICAGQSVPLYAPQGASYLWSTGDSTASIVVSPDSAKIFYVSVTEPTGNIVDSFLVKIKPNPIINIIADTISPAPGSPITLTATGGTNMKYYWSCNSSGAVTTVFPANTTTYAVKGIDMSGCVGVGKVTIIVNNNSTNAQSVYNICPGQTAQLTAPKGSSYSWSTGDSTATIIVSPPDSANKYFVTVTWPTGASVVDSFQVDVKPEPVFITGPNITSPSPGSPVTLSATGGTPMKYYWSNGAIGNVISVSPLVSTTYVVTAYDGKSGCTAGAKVNVNVRSNNLASNSQFVYKICTGQSLALTAPNAANTANGMNATGNIPNGINATNNFSYLWSTGDSTATIIVSPDSAKIYYVTVTPLDSTSAIASVQGFNSIIDSFMVYIKPEPVVSAGTDITSPGVGSPVTLTATGTGTGTGIGTLSATGALSANGGMRYYWNNGIKGNVISVSPVVTTIYTVTAYAKNGCSAAANVTVTVNDINSSSIFIGQDSTGRSIISTIPDSNLYIQSARTASTDTARNTIINSNNAGRVGIGTNSPTEKLTVAGNASFSGSLSIGNNAKINYFPATDSTYATLDFGTGLGSGFGLRTSALPCLNFSIRPPFICTYGGLTANYGTYLLGGVYYENFLVSGIDATSIPGNGYIDLMGIVDRSNPVPILYINTKCGFDTRINNGINGGNVILCSQGNVGIRTNSPKSNLDVNGNSYFEGTIAIGIDPSVPGNTPSGYRLFVKDGILTEKCRVAVFGSGDWADNVFDKKYNLISINELEKFITDNKHLPNIPSAMEVTKSGIDVAQMDALLLQKIEELTLYTIQLQKQIDELKKENTITKDK